jgi:hypothetical protein
MSDLQQLASHMTEKFYLKNKFILCPELENVLRTFARERFFITLIFKPLNNCVSRALKDNNGFTC